MSMNDWININSNSNGKGKGKRNFIKLQSGLKLNFRPAGTITPTDKMWVKTDKGKRAFDVDASDPQIQKLAEKYDADLNSKYLIAGFRRDDEKAKLCLLEGPITLFQNMATWAESTGIQPGGSKAGDWVIKVTGEGTSRRYSTSYLKDTPFTAEEKELIQEHVKPEEGDYSVRAIVKPLSAQEVEAKIKELNGESVDDKDDDEDDEASSDVKAAAGGSASGDDEDEDWDFIDN